MELTKHQRIMIKDDYLFLHFGYMSKDDIDKFTYYVSWDKSENMVIYCKEKPCKGWWQEGEHHAPDYDVPKGSYISSQHIYKNQFIVLIRVTKLSKKIYPKAIEKDGWLEI